jgi:hypothetical protein
MKKNLFLILAGLFIILVSCGPRDTQEAEELSLDTVPEILLEDPDPGLPPEPLQEPIRPTPPVEDITAEDTPAPQIQREPRPIEELQEERIIQEAPRKDTLREPRP